MLYNPNKVKVGVWLQPEVIANCDVYAEYFSQSRSGFMNEALKYYVKHLERHCFLLEEREKNGAKIQAQKHEEALEAYASSASLITLNRLLTFVISPGSLIDKS
jgi:metal-responsive CopG/Arc/MetJ family transcriptional regulator